MRLFAPIAAFCISHASGEIVVADIIAGALSACGSDLNECAELVQSRLEEIVSYEDWSCVVADVSSGKSYYGLKNDDFNYEDTNKQLYAQCAAYRGVAIKQDTLNVECEKANYACQNDPTPACIGDWFNNNYYEAAFCEATLILYEGLFIDRTTQWASAWYDGAAAFNKIQCIAYCK